MWQKLVGNLILLVVFIFAACKNDSSSASTFNIVDTVSINGNVSENNESFDDHEYLEESGTPGNSLPFESAGNLLSATLYNSIYFQDNNESTNTVKVKLLKSKFLEIHDYNKHEIKYSIINCGNFIEGFGGLAQSLQMAYELNGTKSTKEIIAELSGLSYTQTTTHSQAFSYINPELIDWCWKNFYRTPTAGSFADISLNTIYDIVFKKFVRTLLIAHNEIEGNNLENEVSWYRNTVIMEKGFAPELLSKRYLLPDKYSKEDANANYFPHASGFWLRRSIDGTAHLLWNYLRILVMDYDYDWACKTFHICDRG